MLEFIAPSNSTVQSRWLRIPELNEGAEVCVFVAYAPDSAISEHSRFHARAWAEAGFHVIVVINTNAFAKPIQTGDLEFAAGVLARENRGYDFGAWSIALQELPKLKAASLVALTNDSVYGPLDTFDQMLERVRAIDADVIGTTESNECGRHFQSFLLFFKPLALQSDAFWRFWQKVRAGGRLVAIGCYEIEFVRIMEQAGLRCLALFKNSDSRNPTLTRWRDLIEEGFPYLKIALLRDNPFGADLSGWQQALSKHGYDIALATRHRKNN